MDQKLDILVFAAHPDDAELGCSGTILKEIEQGKKVGIVDFTKGEMGTRGTPELRLKEAKKAGEILGLSSRDNLGFQDCLFTIDEEHIVEVVKKIRAHQPKVILANAMKDRHPDHGRAGELVEQAVFWSGLAKLDTGQKPWRPKVVYHYIQDQFTHPDFVIDITEHFDTKLESIKSFSSQFYNPKSKEENSYISSAEFWKFIEARAREYGHFIGCEFGEGFTCTNPIEIKKLI